nr:hypothetical protein B0A51_11229 [Rachicladosporium sp. CCFEE 5018]
MDGLDADTGIHGIPGLSQPVRATEHMSDVRLSKSVWQARGWTYQEEMFPARVIWLSHTGVSWQCSSQTNANFSGSEPKTRSLTRDVNLQTGDSLKFGGFTCPQSYAAAYYERLVKDYSRRAFGEHAPDDRYNAFLGIQRDIERRCAEPIMQGIPFGWLSHYLLWTSANVITSKNRLARRGGIAPPPSWSWTGWLTDVDFPQWKREGDEPDLGVVEWVSDGGVTSPAASTAAIALTDSWTKYPPCTPEAAMPSVHYNDTSSAQIHSSYQEDCTTTQALESSCHERFLLRGRVLVASFRVLQRDLIRPGLTLLVTKGDSGFAGVLHEVNADPWEGEVYVIAISEGAHAIATDGGRVPNGAMYSMHTPTSKRRSGYGYSDRFDHGPPFHWNDYDYDSEDSGLGKELHDYPEYVVQPMAFTYADDEGSLTTSMSSLVLDREYYPGSIYEYYNVMWVEWENGIAYRKGLARIARRVFERECLGWMDITLG